MMLTKRKEYFLLAVLACIQFTHIVDFMLIMPLGPQLMRIMGILPGYFTQLVSAYTISAGIFGFLASFFLDRLERKRAILSVYFGFIVGTFLCGLSHTYITLLLSRFITGAFGGILMGLTMSIIGDVIPIERRGKAMGIVMSSFSIATVLGIPFSLLLANQFSWETPFYFLAFLGSVVWILGYLILPKIRIHLDHDRPKVHPFVDFMAIIRYPNHLYALSLTMVIMLGQFTVIPLINTYMVTNVGFSEQQLVYLYLSGGIFSIVASLLSGHLSDRFGHWRVFSIFSCLCAIPLFFLTHLNRQFIFIPILVSSLHFAFSSGRMVSGGTLVLSAVKPQHRGGFMSLNGCLQQLSAGIAAYVSGLIVYRAASGELMHYSWVGYIAIASCFIAVWIAHFLHRAHQESGVVEVVDEGLKI